MPRIEKPELLMEQIAKSDKYYKKVQEQAAEIIRLKRAAEATSEAPENPESPDSAFTMVRADHAEQSGMRDHTAEFTRRQLERKIIVAATLDAKREAEVKLAEFEKSRSSQRPMRLPELLQAIQTARVAHARAQRAKDEVLVKSTWRELRALLRERQARTAFGGLGVGVE